MLFEKTDNPAHAGEKLSFAERAILKSGVLVAKLALTKLGKARTYGELEKFGRLIEAKMSSFEDSFEDANFDEQTEDEQEVSINNVMDDLTKTFTD